MAEMLTQLSELHLNDVRAISIRILKGQSIEQAISNNEFFIYKFSHAQTSQIMSSDIMI